MDSQSKVRISKQLSLMLRHKPEQFDLLLDEFGSADLEEVLEALRERNPQITRSDILEIVHDPEKQRFEIVEDKIRAKYGHSFPVELDNEPMEPPEFLYYGTEPEVAEIIERVGLEPKGRHYVHLSLTEEVAVEIAWRRTDRPVIFRILAEKAHEAGIEFYDCGPVILTDKVSPEFLERLSDQPSPDVAYGRRKRRVVR